MANDIRQRIVLEGEKEYKNALKEAQRNLKTLRSELKAETAELGNNATAQQKAEAKAKSLRAQIAEQEKIVKANRDALEQVRQKYGDNEDAIAKWEQKLNDSRTALANMKNELDSVGTGFKTVESNADMATVATKSVADSLEKMSGIGETISSGIESAFTGLLDTLKAAAEQIFELITQTAAKADDWGDLADIFGTTATEIQAMERAMGFMGEGKFDSFVNLMNKLSFGGKEDVISEYLGINSKDYEDNLQYTMDVMNALQEYRNTHHGEATDSLMSSLFGAKKSADVLEILGDWDEILEKKKEYEDSGMLLDEDEIKTMSEAYAELNNLDEKWETMKAKFAAGFGQVTLDITAKASNVLDALSEYFNAETDEERDKALEKLEENIVAMFEAAAKAITEGIKALDKVAEDLKNSDNPTAQALGNILSGLVDALKWLTEDNMNNVVHALEILAAFWLTGKGAAMAGQILSIVKNIETIKTFKAGTPITGAGAAATGGATGGSTLGTIGSAVLGLGGLYLIGSGFSWMADRRLNHAEEVRGTEENLAASSGGDEGLQNAFVSYVEAEKALQDFFDSGNYSDEEANTLLDAVEAAKAALDALEGSEGLLDAYSAWRQENGYGDMDWMLPADWWTNTSGGNTGETDGYTSGAGQAVANAVRRGISGWKVEMDAEKVGQMVADYVDEKMAGYILN